MKRKGYIKEEEKRKIGIERKKWREKDKLWKGQKRRNRSRKKQRNRSEVK